MQHPEQYDISLEERLARVIEQAQPDIVHCFGTEYPHTLAMCKVFPHKERILIGIQGLCSLCADAYMADLPQKVAKSVTFRDWLRRDSLRDQQEKFGKRGVQEVAAVRLAGNLTGRTPWDKEHTLEWNPDAGYYAMNETLRKEFYKDTWEEEKCVPHSIFLSQGDYPLKGLHYMLLAMPEILEQYPDATVCVAGNSLTAYDTWKDKLKISAYGKYLRKLMKQYDLMQKVTFLGMLDAREMKVQYLKSHLFVCPSALENSPNSLGEAMLLGMPVVAAEVGGVPGIFSNGKDGIGYEGFREKRPIPENSSDPDEEELTRVARELAHAVLEMWQNEEKRKEYCRNARDHALQTHDGEKNYQRLLEIYADIMEK